VPTVFFLYFLRGTAVREEFEQRILRDVAPRALAGETVESWRLQRTTGWAGGSDDAPDYICVVEVADLDLWSMAASASISETHGSLGALVRRIAMVVTTPCPRQLGDQ
jgi:hypothetical protein